MTDMPHETDKTGKRLTGRHVLAMFVGGFAIIIGVNLYMAFTAVRTFPGLEVSSSYADSQTFDARRTAQEALGWVAEVRVEGDDRLRLSLRDAQGRPVAPAELTALLTRPTSRTEDQELSLSRDAGDFIASAALGPGRWRLRLTGTARDGTEYRHNLTFTID